ncbi:ribonuclease HII [Candidatus Woesearchaeota archaeon]|nr:ribonuclease HII [Candidatus Woesearchaeota archaeon]
MTLICGIDEAGRGPVLGPLVMCGVLVKEENIEQLTKLGVKDSKLLTKEQRANLFEKIKELCEDYELSIVNAEEIDNRYTNCTNLNILEGKKMTEIINHLNPNRVFIDCPDRNPKRYKDFLLNNITYETELIVEHKADLNYPVVAAASILAKVTRDNIIDNLKKEHNIEFGSGYMSDEITQRFLEEHWNNPEYEKIIRKSWQSWKNIKDEKEQKKLGDY